MPTFKISATETSDTAADFPLSRGSESAITVFNEPRTAEFTAEAPAALTGSSGTSGLTITNFSESKLYVLPTATNLIAAGDFESAPSGSWNTPSFIDKSFLSLSQTKVRSGNGSLKFESNGQLSTADLWIDVQKNTDYVLSVSLFGEYLSDTNMGDFSIQLIDPLSNSSVDTGTTVNGIVPTRWDSLWHRRAIAFNSGNAIEIGLRFCGTTSLCYIDDISLCTADGATKSPQANDRLVDPLLKVVKSAEITQTFTSVYASCEASKNLLSASDFSESDLSSWNEMLKWDCISIGEDAQSSSNNVLNYDSTVPRFNNCIAWCDVEQNSEYTVFLKIRGERKGSGAFTLVTNSPVPKRLVNYTPDCFNGVWQTFCVNIKTNDDTKIGFAILDGGGAFSIDNAVVCKCSDARFINLTDTGFINGDAEIGTTDGWRWTTGKQVNVVSSLTDTSVQSEAHKNNSIGGTNYFNSWSWTDITQTVVLKPNATYAVSLDYYATNGNASITVSNTEGDIATTALSQSNTWKNGKIYFTVEDINIVIIKINTGWDSFAFDNVTLTQISSESRLVNGNAECNRTFGWTNKRQSDTGSFTVVDSENSTSAASVAHKKLADESGNFYFSSWSFNEISQNVKLKPNTSYGFLFRYYAENYNSTWNITDKEGSLLSVPGSKEVNKWIWGLGTFKTGDDADITLTINTGWGTYCFDNIEITELKVDNSLINGDMAIGINSVCCGWETNGSSYVNSPDRKYLEIWTGKYAQQNLKLEPDTLYNLSFEGKCTQNATVSLIGADSKVIASKTICGDWQKVSIIFATDEYTDGLTLKFTAPANFSVSNVSLDKAFYCEKNTIMDSLQVYDTYGLDLREGIRYFFNLTVPESKNISIDGTEFSVVSTGMIFSTENNLPKAGLTTDLISEDTFCGGLTESFISEEIDVNGNLTRKYSGLVNGITSKQRKRQIVARAYLICLSSSGIRKTLYSDQQCVNVLGIFESTGADYYKYPVKQWMK